MKHFSKHWKASTKAKKQRKYLANAPLHIKRKFLSVSLIKSLREKYKTRNVEARKGDVVKITRGKYKGKTGKITQLKTRQMKVYIEGIQKKKQDGSMVEIPFRPSKLQITELFTEDKKRFKKRKTEAKSEEKKETSKKEGKSEIKKEKNKEEKK